MNKISGKCYFFPHAEVGERRDSICIVDYAVKSENPLYKEKVKAVALKMLIHLLQYYIENFR